MRTLHLFALLFLSCTFAAAQPSGTQLSLGLRLAELLREKELFGAYLKQCVEPKGSPFDPDSEFNTNPSIFRGLSPQSAYWPEVHAIYDRFRAAACAYATAEKMEQYLAEQYAAQIEDSDLRAAIAFYESPIGRRLSLASVRISESFQRYAQSLLGKAYDSASDEFTANMRTLHRKYKMEPR